VSIKSASREHHVSIERAVAIARAGRPSRLSEACISGSRMDDASAMRQSACRVPEETSCGPIVV
jgi:hypothetical protein